MFAIIVIVLLILIAIGVLLMTEGGKAILGGIGSLAIIGAILFVLFWIVVLGYMFFHSPVAMASMSAFGTGIGFLLLFLGFVAFVWLAVRFFRDLFTETPKVFTWKERKEMSTRLRQFSQKHLSAIVGLTILWFIALMFFGMLPDAWQTPALAVFGWPLLLMFAILIVFLVLGCSKARSVQTGAEK
jgi:hypothetical protein